MCTINGMTFRTPSCTLNILCAFSWNKRRLTARIHGAESFKIEGQSVFNTNFFLKMRTECKEGGKFCNFIN